MQKIASPQELQAELRAIQAFIHASEKPDRQVVASKLRALADRVAGVPEELTHRLAPAEVARLPVGSIVWKWVRDSHSGPLGRVDGSPWIVNQGNVILPIAVLPERSSGQFPDDGENPASVAKEFVVVNKGRGKLLTGPAAQRISLQWQRANSDLGRM